jgi:hypothetical protein
MPLVLGQDCLSSVAKGYIVASTALVDIVAGNAALITYLNYILVASATGIPDGNATSLQAFTGIPSKVLVLQAKEAGIAATFSPYNFGGTPMTEYKSRCKYLINCSTAN